MLKKFFIRTACLSAAFALPAMFFGLSDHAKGVWNRVSTAISAPANGPAQAAAASTAPDGGAALAQPGKQFPMPTALIPAEKKPVPVEGSAVGNLAEVLHFGVTPEWVLAHWPHVTTGLAMLQLQGYRVALVTGTAEHDVAGALTYYFNAQQQCQRITFHGSSGDPRQLINTVATQHHMMRQVKNDAGLVAWESAHSPDSPGSVLTIRSASIVKANDPYKRYEIDLTLERPGSE